MRLEDGLVYELIFDERVMSKLEKLPRKIRERIFKRLQKTKENPYHFFEKLVGRSEFKLRIGDYRVIADIIDNKVQILVLHVDHRRRVYKNM